MLKTVSTGSSTIATPRDLRFVTRIYRLRMIGLGLGFFCVASVLFQNGVHPAIWALLVFDTLVWPHLACRLALRSENPRGAEIINLQIDSAMGGLWIALMQFNLLPSVVLAVMLAIDKVHVGGPRLLARSLACQLLACLLISSLCGFALRPETSTLNILFTFPLLIGYPLAISGAAHTLLRHTRDQARHLEQLNRIDAASGLLNRAYWQNGVAHELRRFQRTGQIATLMMIDVDEFKRINDDYGHTVGDEVIRAVSTIIRECTRDIDLCGRYGGDEFGAVLVNSTVTRASTVAERIRARVATLRLEQCPMLGCSVSIGMAEAERSMHDSREWMKQADAALYRAKAQGRNRIATLGRIDSLLAAS